MTHRQRRGRDPNRPPQMQAALDAAQAGHFVFPLLPRSKVPALHGERTCPGSGPSAGGHQGWEERATRDAEKIRRWWGSRPFNIGIATGPSELHVLDLDPGRGDSAPQPWTGASHGRDVLAQLAADAGQPYPGNTFAVETPSGGEHLYFRAPPGRRLRSTIGRLGWKVDTRGAGGYVVGVGSVRTAEPYRVLRDVPIARLPDWLVLLLEPAIDLALPDPDAPVHEVSERRRAAYLDAVLARVAEAAPGTRHLTILRASYTLGRLVAGGVFTEHDVRKGLRQAAATLTGFSSREARRTIEDGLRYGSRAPRTLPN